MAQCVILSSGAVVESTADPCTGFVLLTPAEYNAVASSPFNLSLEDGAAIAVLVLTVWTTAYCVRALIRSVQGYEGESDV